MKKNISYLLAALTMLNLSTDDAVCMKRQNEKVTTTRDTATSEFASMLKAPELSDAAIKNGDNLFGLTRATVKDVTVFSFMSRDEMAKGHTRAEGIMRILSDCKEIVLKEPAEKLETIKPIAKREF